MANTGDVTGDLDDEVTVVVGGLEIKVAESYEVTQSVLQQPSSFSIKLGWGDVLTGLIVKAKPGTEFQLLVGGQLQQTGAIDGYEADDSPGASSLTIHGRDALAPLHDAFIEEEKSYANSTYQDLVIDQIKSVIPEATVFLTNDANRSIRLGVGMKAQSGPSAVTRASAASRTTANVAAFQAAKTAESQSKQQQRQLKCKIGERRFEFVKRELDRAGLFLWAAADGSFVLSAPNAKQAPAYRILRQRGLTRNAVNVESVRYRNSTEGRYSSCDIYAKAGGKKFGRTKAHGRYVDPEMTAYGFNRPLVLRDVNVTSPEQGEFYARRKLAEARRAGWSLVYTVAGHTVPSLIDGSRVVWGCDTVVQVQDDELGLKGNYWIERVTFRRNPQTTTELTLMRPDDLVFGTDES